MLALMQRYNGAQGLLLACQSNMFKEEYVSRNAELKEAVLAALH
jgi:hypothetical protein